MARPQSEASVDIDYSTTPVPYDARMPRGALTMAWWAMCSGMFYLVVAATFAINFGTLNAILGLLASAAAFSLINAVIVRFAVRTGLSVALFSPAMFGTVGAAIATFIFFATAIYYGVFEGSVIAVAIHAYAPVISLRAAFLIVVVYSVVFVLGSIQRWLDKFNGFLLPFYLVGMVAALAAAVARHGVTDAWMHIGPEGGAVSIGGIWHTFTHFMGAWILMMYTLDYSRFGRLEDVEYHAKVNFGWPFYLFSFVVNGIAGLFLVGTLQTRTGLSEISVVKDLLDLMGIYGLLFVWVTQTRINTTNFYLAATNMHAFGERIFHLRLPRFAWAVIVGLIVYAIMLTDVFSFILQALAYQGIFVVAWVAIALAHIACDRTEYSPDSPPKIQTRPFNARGLTAWFSSSAIGIVLANSGGAIASFSAPVTALAAFACYALMFSRAPRAALADAETVQP